MKELLFLLLPATSLLYLPFNFEQFENSKAFALVSFGCFAAFWVNWKTILEDEIATCLYFFTISAALSTYFSADQHISIFGNIKSRFGLLVITSLLIFYLSALEVLKQKKVANKAIDIILGCSAIIATYAIFQAMGHDFKQWSGTLTEGGYTRPIGTLGHPNFMANYLAMTLPFALWRLNKFQSIWKKLLYLFIALISVTAIWFSLSRGMCIAAIIGIMTYFLYSRVKFTGIFTAFAIGIILLSSTLLIFPKFRDMALSRMSEIVSPGGPRIEYPKTAIRIWRQYPWVGVGTDNFERGFQNARSAHYWAIERNGSPHRAHNDFLNILATQGILGAIAVILLTLSIWFRIKHSESPFIAPATASIAVFYVAGLTSYMVIATSVMFLLCIALLKTEQ